MRAFIHTPGAPPRYCALAMRVRVKARAPRNLSARTPGKRELARSFVALALRADTDPPARAPTHPPTLLMGLPLTSFS